MEIEQYFPIPFLINVKIKIDPGPDDESSKTLSVIIEVDGGMRTVIGRITCRKVGNRYRIGYIVADVRIRHFNVETVHEAIPVCLVEQGRIHQSRIFIQEFKRQRIPITNTIKQHTDTVCDYFQLRAVTLYAGGSSDMNIPVKEYRRI